VGESGRASGGATLEAFSSHWIGLVITRTQPNPFQNSYPPLQWSATCLEIRQSGQFLESFLDLRCILTGF
jgi:hypothetical protein